MALSPLSTPTDEGAAVAATAALLRADPWRMACLEAVRTLGLPDGWLAAGFLRNAIWDHLHGKRTPLNDIDVIYHAPCDLAPAGEARLERRLGAQVADARWEVRNQARMHLRHGHAPYRDCLDAVSHWIERPTCVGVRLDGDGGLRFLAPFGLLENWSLRVAPNAAACNAAAYRQRIAAKRWAALWPRLTIAA